MIKLRNIKHNGDIITCDAFPEDCKSPIRVIFYISTKRTEHSKLPDGYDWWSGHIEKAKWHLLKMLKNNEELPKERNIVWG